MTRNLAASEIQLKALMRKTGEYTREFPSLAYSTTVP
jgi:hypothetical protein